MSSAARLEPGREHGIAIFLLVGFVLCTAAFAGARVRSTLIPAPSTFAAPVSATAAPAGDISR